MLRFKPWVTQAQELCICSSPEDLIRTNKNNNKNIPDRATVFSLPFTELAPGYRELKGEPTCLRESEMWRVLYDFWPTRDGTVYGTSNTTPWTEFWSLVCIRLLRSCDPVTSLTSLPLGSAQPCWTPRHRSSHLIIRDTVRWGSLLGWKHVFFFEGIPAQICAWYRLFWQPSKNPISRAAWFKLYQHLQERI